MYNINEIEPETKDILDICKEVFIDEKKFNQWINIENTSINNKKPIELLLSKNPEDKILFIQIVSRIAHGIFS